MLFAPQGIRIFAGTDHPMKKKECPSCAMEIDENSKVCPVCSFEFPTRSKTYLWIAVGLLIVFLLTLLNSVFHFL